MTSRIRDQEYSPWMIWEDWLRMYDKISCWICSPFQGNGTINKVETPGQPTIARFGGWGGYASKWSFSRCRPKANGSGPLLNASRKWNKISNTKREGMAGAKPRTLLSSAHQIYGKVPAKIYHTLFCKSIDCRKQDSERFTKIWGKITGEKRHVHAPHPGKMYEPKFLFLPCTRKINGCAVCSKFMLSASTGYGLHLETLCNRHSCAISSRKQAQEG